MSGCTQKFTVRDPVVYTGISHKHENHTGVILEVIRKQRKSIKYLDLVYVYKCQCGGLLRLRANHLESM